MELDFLLCSVVQVADGSRCMQCQPPLMSDTGQRNQKIAGEAYGVVWMPVCLNSGVIWNAQGKPRRFPPGDVLHSVTREQAP
jgi:hypothetical protein